MNLKKSLLVLVALLLLNTLAFAGVKVSGEFIATKECNAYVSKRKKTNPEDVKIVKDKSYSIIGLNVTPNTTWYRIDVPSASIKQRWVYHECGEATVSQSIKTTTQSNCDISGLSDGYVFAVSWQAAFCLNKSKKECLQTDPNSYQATNFTLHGLWPNKKSCGTRYGFCGKYKKPVKGFCNFDKLSLNNTTRTNLEEVMPSAKYGTCLQRHEWYKHGTCQTSYDENEYFNLAIALTKDFNTGVIHKFMSENIGKIVKTNNFFDVINTKFGKNTYKRFKFICRNNALVDLYINLPKVIPQGVSLKNLLQKADEAFSSSCGDSFKVVPIGSKNY